MTVRHLVIGSRAAGWLGAVALALAAAGCGGGGGGGDPAPTFSDPPAGPPAAAASIGSSSADAMDATRAAVATADGLVARQASMNGLAAVLGVQVAGMDTPVASELIARVSRSPQLHPERARILATTTDPCTDFVDAPCTGTVTTDTNIADNATSISAGQYAEATFNNINGFLLGRAVTFSGKLRIEFLTGVSTTSGSFAGMGLRIKFTAFAGTVAANPFGPISETVDLNISSQGVPTLVTGGVRYGTVANVTSTGSGAYTIGTGTARLGYGAAGTGYVDVNLSSWRISAGRPLVGSTGSVAAGSVTVTVTVASSSASTVTYNVSIASGGVTKTFLVTAQYTGNTPAYSAAATN